MGGSDGGGFGNPQNVGDFRKAPPLLVQLRPASLLMYSCPGEHLTEIIGI